jgi:hypothetical protein
MQPSLISLTSWGLLAVSLLFGVAGVFFFLAWLHTGNWKRMPWLYFFFISLLFAVFALAQTKAKYEAVRELSQFTTLYPGAAPADGKGSYWGFETKDNPDEVRAFYQDLANRQRIPFQDAGRDRFVIGDGTNAVSITMWNVAGVTRISYRLVNNGASDPD